MVSNPSRFAWTIRIESARKEEMRVRGDVRTPKLWLGCLVGRRQAGCLCLYWLFGSERRTPDAVVRQRQLAWRLPTKHPNLSSVF
ncbi:unnamed protein product [Ixodes pacificus]